MWGKAHTNSRQYVGGFLPRVFENSHKSFGEAPSIVVKALVVLRRSLLPLGLALAGCGAPPAPVARPIPSPASNLEVHRTPGHAPLVVVRRSGDPAAGFAIEVQAPSSPTESLSTLILGAML